MKKTLFYAICFALCILTCACGEQQQAKDKKETKKPIPRTHIQFTEYQHDFGKITQGENVTYYFTYKNTGDNPLIVSQVQPSCGCTVPEWTREPVAPGEEGKIEVLFNSEGRSGRQHKTVTVVSNTNPPTNELTFTAEVVVPKKEQ
jgi:hypothetical protein